MTKNRDAAERGQLKKNIELFLSNQVILYSLHFLKIFSQCIESIIFKMWAYSDQSCIILN